MSNRETASTFWDRAVIHLDDREQADVPLSSPRKVIVRPERLDVSLLKKVADGTLATENTEIDIFGSVAKYKFSITSNVAVADLREQSKAEWNRLQQRGLNSPVNGPTAIAEFEHRTTRLKAFDKYVNAAGHFLHQQYLSLPLQNVFQADLWTDERLLNQARDDWLRFAHAQKHRKENEILLKQLASRQAEAKRTNDESAQLTISKEVNERKSQVLYFWHRKMEEKLEALFTSRNLEAVDEVVESYTLFQSLKVEENNHNNRTILQLVKTHDESQVSLTSKIENILVILDANLNAAELLTTSCKNLSRKANTRMRRLCAVDVAWKGEQEQRRVAEKRFMDDKEHGYFKSIDELEDVLSFQETAREIMEKIEMIYGELECMVLCDDVLVNAEMAILMVDERLRGVKMEET